MIGPYSAECDGRISFVGNNVFGPISDVRSIELPTSDLEARAAMLPKSNMWPAISRLNHRINMCVNKYFDNLGALFVPLPLTTRMISSPGAVYGREAINFTTDTCPITLNWFDLPKTAFLSESSQIYLELSLLQSGVNHVFANYSSFRKEESDATHLSEFHHVEYEGHVQQSDNVLIAKGLIDSIIKGVLSKNETDLATFLSDKDLKDLDDIKNNSMPLVSLSDALNALYQDTKDDKYKRFTLQNFGSWEEVRLTQLFGGMVGVTNMPLLEVPFYHARNDSITILDVADNTDIIWPGYRETVGSGHRVRSVSELDEKARIFQLPRDDYEPYMQSRRHVEYKVSSGFGLGWERLVQGMLKMPFIYSASLFPRVHTTLRP